ncbi:MAG: radical SAM protein [Steroidobacteraceae bacterium]
MSALAPPAPAAGVGLVKLRELWLHTGTACNLSCPFCHEGSAPADRRLDAMDVTAARQLIDEAVALGVERFAFTGGEPLILRGIVDILAHAQMHRPCLVLTNGTAPLLRRPQQLARLREGRHPVSFRVSIDHPDETQHDAGRGLKTFRRALEGLRLLQLAGFEIGVTRLSTEGEDVREIEARFRSLLRRHGFAADLPIVALPDLGRPHETNALAIPADLSPQITECSRSRMAVSRNGALRILPCPLVDDDASLELGSDLTAATNARVPLRHRRCHICLTRGVDYAG